MTSRVLLIAIVVPLAFTRCGGGEAPANGAGAGSATVQAAPAGGSACDLVMREEVAEATGIPVTNVTSKDYDSFASCSYEAEDWTQTSGVLYYPSLAPVAGSAALAEAIRLDLEKDQAPYTTPAPGEGLGDASATYSSDDGIAHFLVVQRGGKRIVLSGPRREALPPLAQLALGRM